MSKQAIEQRIKVFFLGWMVFLVVGVDHSSRGCGGSLGAADDAGEVLDQEGMQKMILSSRGSR